MSQYPWLMLRNNRSPFHQSGYRIALVQILSRNNQSVTWSMSMTYSGSILGFNRIHTVMGGSIGGFQALEYSIMYPDLIKNLVFIAASVQIIGLGQRI